LNKALKTFAKIILSIFGFYSVVVITCFSYVSCSYLPNLKSATDAVQSQLPALIDDLKALEKENLFSPAKNVHNAEPFIDEQISNLGYDDPFNTKGIALQEMESQLTALVQNEEYFKNLMANPRLQFLYTDWLNSIQKYGLWDLRSNLNYEGLFGKALVSGASARVAHIAKLIDINPTLIKLAQAHLIKMHLKGDTKEGLLAIRKISQLISTSQTQSGNSGAVRLLNFERNFVETQKIKNVQPIEKEKTDRFERVIKGWQGVLLLGWAVGLPEEIKPYMKPELGFCGAVNDMFIRTPTGYYSALVPTVFLESDLKPYYERSLAVQTEMLKLCGFHNFLPLLEPVLNPEHKHKDFADWVMENVPYVRRIVGLSKLRSWQP
jgi:hypothetical protein